MTIIHIPRQFMKDFDDAREQRVMEVYPQTEDSIARAKAEKERALSEPCTPCGQPLKAHWSISGAWIGCAGAAAVAARPYPWPTDPQRWNDPYVASTVAMANAMRDGGCGPRMEIDAARYTRDELLTLASTLFRIGMSEYLRDKAAK